MRSKLLILALLFLFFGAGSVLAVTVTVSGVPAIISDQPFSLNVSVSGASPATNYLRANLFPTGTTNYFGYTFNGTSFVNSSDYSQYFSITIDSSGNWNGTIQAQMDTTSSYYSSPGTYSLKVRRYTKSGSSYTWSNEVTTNIFFQVPTPTPTSAPTPKPSPTATPVPTHTPAPAANPSSTPKSSILPSDISQTLPSNQPASSGKPGPTEFESPAFAWARRIANSAYRLASVAAATTSATPPAQVNIKDQKQTNPIVWAGFVFILIGTSLIGYIYLKKNAKIHL